MSLPFSLSGRIQLDAPTSIESLLKLLEEEVRKQRPRSIERRGDTIHFTGGILRSVSSWNILVPIDQGSISVEKDEQGLALTFHVSYVQLFMIATAMTFGVMGPFILAEPDLDPLEKVAILALMWAWFFLGNVVTSFIRFPSFLRRVVARGT